MTFLFALMILAVFLGGVLLWLSGLTVGLRSGSELPDNEELVKLLGDRDKLTAEATRVVEEMERVENELTMAAEEMKRLRDENKALKANGASKKSKPSPPAPPQLPPTPPPLPVKVPSEIPESSDPSGGAGARRDRNNSGFKTMSIDNRSQSVSGTDHDRLRQSYDQTTREKDRLETELARTQQELQLLKMRQK